PPPASIAASATTAAYALSLHDALPISTQQRHRQLFFQLTQRPADVRSGLFQLLGRGADRAAVDHADKDGYFVEVGFHDWDRFRESWRKLMFGGDAVQQQPAAVLGPVRYTRLRMVWLPCQFRMRSRPPGAAATSCCGGKKAPSQLRTGRFVLLIRCSVKDGVLLPMTDTAYYIYALKDPRQSPARPFYIGKGTGTRAWDHVARVDETRKGKRIQKIHAAGHDVVTSVLADGLSEIQAL